MEVPREALRLPAPNAYNPTFRSSSPVLSIRPRTFTSSKLEYEAPGPGFYQIPSTNSNK